VISISLVLFLLEVILLVGFLGKELSEYVKENIMVSVVLNDDLTDVQIRRMRDRLEEQPFVKSTEYISKEQAALEMQRELGENPETFLGFNPFRASIEVKLKSEYTHPDSLPLIEKRIASQVHVSNVQYRRDMMQTVNRNIRRASLVLFLLLVVLIVISFVLINNTVRLLIYSRRFLIYTMRLVGATPSFIRGPFIRHSLVSGLIAGILAIFMLIGSLSYIKYEFADLGDILHPDTIMLIFGLVMVSGIILSVVAAYFAVNRYLRMTRGQLYYV
jgi:cell division transport system permease protein